MKNGYRNSVKAGGSLFVALIRGSLIIRLLDKLSAKVYNAIAGGFFGWLFTGYPIHAGSGFLAALRNTKIWQGAGRIRHFINREIEESLVCNLVTHFLKCFLRCRIRLYGVFGITFGAYSAIACLITSLADNTLLADQTNLYFAMVICLLSSILLFSKSTLAEAVCKSAVGRLILWILDYTPEEVRYAARGEVMYRQYWAFIWGTIFGTVSIFVSPLWIIGAAVLAIGAYMILLKPEVGVLVLFFAMPLLPTMALAGITIFVFLCTMLKVLRGKRIVRVEPLDILVMAFAAITFFSGVISLSNASLKPALLYVCFMLGYFEVVWLLRKRDWLIRCSVGAVVSSVLVSLYGILQYFTGVEGKSEAWLDSEMFSSISERVTGTLENPNMLGEYLILIIPIAVGMLIGFEGLRRVPALLCIGITGCCLIMTWSRGAWIGLMMAAVIFLFLWHRRAVWMIFAGVAALPFLQKIVSADLLHRLTSIGDMNDSSTAYRAHIWRATCNMLADHGLTGIGIGEGAWDKLYPQYAFLAVEAAPHSHNLFLQIWLEMGVLGLVVFLLVLFFLLQSVFTFYRRLYDTRELMLLPGQEYEDADDENANGFSVSSYNRHINKAKAQLRISCAAPLCGLLAVLVQGLTDYAWYNYRVYLMFWLVIGLTSAYVRTGSSMILETPPAETDSAFTDIGYAGQTGRKSRRKKKTEK